MPRRTDLSDCTLLPDADALSRVVIAISMEIKSLPQLKGKGKPNRLEIEREVHAFAERVFKHLTESNMVFARGPGTQPHSNSGHPSAADLAEIPVGLPRLRGPG